MLVKMTEALSGPLFLLQPGDTREFPDAEAMRLIGKGFAVPVERQIERAVSEPIIERRRKR